MAALLIVVGPVKAQLVEVVVDASVERPDVIIEQAVQSMKNPDYSPVRGNKYYLARPALGADIAWDRFFHEGTSIWMCREIKSGFFVPPRFCAKKERVDSQWPGDALPPTFNGQIGEYELK